MRFVHEYNVTSWKSLNLDRKSNGQIYYGLKLLFLLVMPFFRWKRKRSNWNDYVCVLAKYNLFQVTNHGISPISIVRKTILNKASSLIFHIQLFKICLTIAISFYWQMIFSISKNANTFFQQTIKRRKSEIINSKNQNSFTNIGK